MHCAVKVTATDPRPNELIKKLLELRLQVYREWGFEAVAQKMWN